MPHLNPRTTHSLLLVVTAIATLSAPIGQAGDLSSSDGVLRVHVRYGDLNVSTPEGARALLRRLKGAAERVCEPFRGRDLQRMQEFETCYDRALFEAVQAVDRANVTALYTAPGGTRAGR